MLLWHYFPVAAQAALTRLALVLEEAAAENFPVAATLV
jgi:hypothetical protein